MRKPPLVSLLLVAFLAACGKSETPAPSAAAPAAAPAPAAAAAPAADNGALAAGEGIYKKTCSMCHQAGVAGAPKLGDKADWGPRLAKGKDEVYKHAIEGFTGEKGMMPPKGGNAALSDDDVKAAVDYMAAKAG